MPAFAGMTPPCHVVLASGARIPWPMPYYVYLLASRRNGTLYVGVTSDLVRRVHEHRSHAVPGFTARHGITQLVWFDSTPDVEAAIRREKQIKDWKRAWKVDLIERSNPYWRDLWEDIAR